MGIRTVVTDCLTFRDGLLTVYEVAWEFDFISPASSPRCLRFSGRIGKIREVKAAPRSQIFLRGELPVSIIHETDSILALMDIQPVNPGHVLVIPSGHASYLADLAPGGWW